MPLLSSAVLREVGFHPMCQVVFASVCTACACAEDRETFYHATLKGARKTFAIDEDGRRWEGDGWIDLRRCGFRFFDTGETEFQFDGLKMFRHSFWKSVGGNLKDAFMLSGLVIFLFGKDHRADDVRE